MEKRKKTTGLKVLAAKRAKMAAKKQVHRATAILVQIYLRAKRKELFAKSAKASLKERTAVKAQVAVPRVALTLHKREDLAGQQ